MEWKICDRWACLIGKNLKTKSGTDFKVIGMVTTTAFGALFVVEYAEGFKLGTMLPTVVEECARPILNTRTKEEEIDIYTQHLNEWLKILESGIFRYGVQRPNPRRG